MESPELLPENRPAPGWFPAQAGRAMFEDWDNFYLLVGSAAAALIGLLFVVATLTAGIEQGRARRGETLFMTPTVFDFAVIVVVSALAMTPRLSPPAIGQLLLALAATALIYVGGKAVA